jgi:hypothetical protein
MPIKYNEIEHCVTKLRNFLISRGFMEVHNQPINSHVVNNHNHNHNNNHNHNHNHKLHQNTLYKDKVAWPNTISNKLWLEHILLDNPQLNGCFRIRNYISNSPICEFESKGNINDLMIFEKNLLQWIGFKQCKQNNITNTYQYTNCLMGEYGRLVDWSKYKHSSDKYPIYPDYICSNKNILNSMHKSNSTKYHDKQTQYPVYDGNTNYKQNISILNKDEPVIFIENDKNILNKTISKTSNLWNIKKDKNKIYNINVFLYGNETIIGAERSSNKDEIVNSFNINTINDDYKSHDSGGSDESNGLDEPKLSDLFKNITDEIIKNEFDDFIKKDFFERYGGEINIKNMTNAIKNSRLDMI